jgi:hypothetical protein
VFICNECVDLSATIIAATIDEAPEVSARRREEFVAPSVEDVLTLLPTLARSAAQLETDLARWVRRLRGEGADWQRIADALGMTVDVARQHFEPRPPA